MAKKNVNPKIQHKGGSKPAHPVKDIRAGLAKHKKQGITAAPEQTGWLNALTRKPWLPWALMGFLLVCVSLLYFPVAFGGKTPQASDISQWQGAANKIIEYNENHTDNALWTQSMFSGMPAYMISFPNRWPFLENLSRLTDKLINWRIFLLFIGALGMFLLLRFLKLDVWTSFFGAVAFMFSCHWLGLVEIGHNTKFRAIMYIPWVIWAFMRLRQKPGLLSLGFLATALIVQLRENHPQISYYLYLFLGLYWLWQLVESIRAKDHKSFWLFTLLAVVAVGLTLLAVLNPYLSTMEYSKFTQRGGSSGLETSYAQGWSFHPLEILTLIIPDFYGGVAHLENGQGVNNYWGYMPSTQIYNYFGLAVLVLGLFPLFYKKHRRLAIFLCASSFVFMIMSFGSATPWLSNIFMKYLPYFNKFRVPSMILTMVQVNAVILAALGLDGIVQNAAQLNSKWSTNILKVFWACGALFIIWLISAKGIFKGLSFATAEQIATYAQNNASYQLQELKEIRLDMLYKSGILSLLFLTISMGLAYLASIRKLNKTAFILLTTFVVFVDLYIYTGKNLKSENMQDQQQYQAKFDIEDYDEYLLTDKDNFRIYPIDLGRGHERFPGEWAYYHQTINGYSAAKLKRYDNLLKHIQGDQQKSITGEVNVMLTGMYPDKEGVFPVDKPTPLIDMLSTKYLVFPQPLPNDSLFTINTPPLDQFYNKLTPVFKGFDGTSVYRNETALPRAWFVDSVRKVAPADSILPLLRSESFDPRRLAYVESNLTGIQAPDSARVTQTVAEMHKLAYEVYTDKPAFLVLSEIYYPAGWKASLDGKEIPIHAANYILRGLQIPAGAHKLELAFAPESYKTGVGLSLIGLLASLLALGGGLAYTRLKRRPAPAESLDDR